MAIDGDWTRRFSCVEADSAHTCPVAQMGGRNFRCSSSFILPGVVSIHAPTRGATAECPAGVVGNRGATTAGRRFQSTHPRGVRLSIEILSGRRGRVSIHAPTRGATLMIQAVAISFNPRTHAGCDFAHRSEALTPVVSIHAPTRGATRSWKRTAGLGTVSIHAPTRGARP